MRKLIYSLAATLLLSAAAVAADDTASPVAPERYPRATCGIAGLGRRGHRIHLGTRHSLQQQRPKQYPFKLSGVSVATLVAAGNQRRG